MAKRPTTKKRQSRKRPASKAAPAAQQQEQQQGLSMDQVTAGLASCVSVLTGEADEKQERRERDRIVVGLAVMRQICNGNLLLISPDQIQQVPAGDTPPPAS